MSDANQGEGWWLASDGKWYPPALKPNHLLPPPPPGEVLAAGGLSLSPRQMVSLNPSLAGWTEGVMWVIGAAAAVYAVLAINYSRTLTDFLARRGSLNAAVEAENNFNGFGPWFALLWIIGFVLQVVWLVKAHISTTSLLVEPAQRKYSRGWAIGVWFIPLANLISTPQVFAEHQRIADAPRNNGWADEQWKSIKVRSVLIWWWVLMLIGFILNRGGASTISDPSTPLNEYRIGLTVFAIGMLTLGAGMVCGAMFIREVSKNLRPESL